MACSVKMKPVRIKGGYALTPDRPGSGLAWNEEMVGRLLALV